MSVNRWTEEHGETRSRTSDCGFEIYAPEGEDAWLASDLTVPLSDVQ